MAEPVEQCTFTVDSMQRSGNDYFARWTMRLESSAAKGEIIETIGISHVRYNAEGKIIFQQDYWDTSSMFDRLPVVGFWTRLVKAKIEKGLEIPIVYNCGGYESVDTLKLLEDIIDIHMPDIKYQHTESEPTL